jgi:hypothetical protein
MPPSFTEYIKFFIIISAGLYTYLKLEATSIQTHHASLAFSIYEKFGGGQMILRGHFA